MKSFQFNKFKLNIYWIKIAYFISNFQDGSHEHTKVQIEEGPTFQIVSNVEKGAFLVSVLDSTGISQKSRGIIGQFVREDAYAIQTDGETDEEGNKIGQIVAGWDYLNFCRYKILKIFTKMICW